MSAPQLAGTSGAQLRRVMAHWPTGITVITATDLDGSRVGLVCNSFTSISLDPPLVSWAVDLGSSAIRSWERVDAYSVHILSEDDRAYVQQFCRPGSAKFDGVQTLLTDLGTPTLPDIEVRLDCRVVARYEAGDHLILLGKVITHRTVDHYTPLTNHALKRH
jgi:3-hydroxy-9,10-secoandrosta-1,3,5(10)-triene-9,17-dione monooxygenase reductase component